MRTNMPKEGDKSVKNKSAEVLKKYKTLDSTIEEVQEVFGDQMKLTVSTYAGSLSFNPPFDDKEIGEINISSKDVEKVLNKFINGEIEPVELLVWAFVVEGFQGVYTYASGESTSKREVTREIISKLDEIDKSFDKTKASKYLEMIQKAG